MTHVVTSGSHILYWIKDALTRVEQEITAREDELKQLRENYLRYNAESCAGPTWFERRFLGKEFTAADRQAYVQRIKDADEIWWYHGNFRLSDEVEEGNAAWLNGYARSERLKSERTEWKDIQRELKELKVAAESDGADAFHISTRVFNLFQNDVEKS